MSIDYQGSGGGVPRKTAKIFASDAANNDVTIFGSTLNSTTAYTTDIADIQNEYFEDGWRSAVISNKNYPLLADMNGVQKTFSQQIAYVLQHGIPQWDSGTTYYTYDIVNVNGVLYISTIDSNTNNNPTGGTGWAEYYNPDDEFAYTDLSNVPTSKGILIEKGLSEDGTAGYRKYADGFIEQWGTGTGTSNGVPVVFDFLTAFTTTNYNFQLKVSEASAGYVSLNTDYYNITKQTNKATALYGIGGAHYEWYAVGY